MTLVNLFKGMLLAGFVQSTGAWAHDTIFVLPPDTPHDKTAIAAKLIEAATSLKREDTLMFFNARGAQIGTIRTPDDARSSNPAWVKRKRIEQLAPVLSHVLALPSVPALGDIPENIMIPNVLDEIGRNVVPSLPARKADVLLAGSFFYYDRQDGRFAMTDRFFPSDGHIRASLAETPFGTAGLSKRLSGVTAHFCWDGGREAFATPQHENAVKRLWSNWTQAQDGKVGTMSYDLATCLRRALAGDASGQASYSLSADAKLEMLRARPPLATRVPANLSQPGEYFLRDDAPISRTPPTSPLGVAWIGIKWTTPNIDLDLYARGDPKNNFLFFANTRTEEGLFNKDFTSATGDKQFEYIEFSRAIDLSKAEVAINLFSGDLATPLEGVLRIWFEAKIFEAPFRIGPARANRGATPIGGPQWIKIDLRKVVGLIAN